LPLLGMQEDGPFVPRIIEGPRQFLDVGHDPKPALGIGMSERIGNCGRRLRHARAATGRQFQECLGGFARQVFDDGEQ
jgi:hypothetical protein